MTPDERQNKLLAMIGPRWSTVAYLTWETKIRRQQITSDLYALNQRGVIQLDKVNHAVNAMGKKRSVAVLMARRDKESSK